jgi:CheY-like chemotaxis protein
MSALVLVVDDDPTIQIIIKHVLDKEGHTPIVCPNGEVAIQMMQTLEFRVVILDLNLPGIDGWKVFEFIEKEAPRTAVLLLTGTRTEKVNQFLEDTAGRNDVGVSFKPIQKDEFIPTLEQLIQVSMTKRRSTYEFPEV